MSLVYRSAVASLAVQLLITAVTAVGFAIDVPSEQTRRDLDAILGLEVVSQVVEFAWYTIVVLRAKRIQTWSRYLDWVVSTPVMLVSTSLFFYHRQPARRIEEVFETPRLYACLALNWVMLGFGLSVERGWWWSSSSRALALWLGSAAFVGSFTLLATFVDGGGNADGLSVGLFAAMYVVWSLYGVAATLPDVGKNVCYNALDVVSKNFYGVFLVVYAATR